MYKTPSILTDLVNCWRFWIESRESNFEIFQVWIERRESKFELFRFGWREERATLNYLGLDWKKGEQRWIIFQVWTEGRESNFKDFSMSPQVVFRKKKPVLNLCTLGLNSWFTRVVLSLVSKFVLNNYIDVKYRRQIGLCPLIQVAALAIPEEDWMPVYCVWVDQ